MKKLCVVDVMGALYRQRIYQVLDSQYDCIWLFGKPEGGIKSMDDIEKYVAMGVKRFGTSSSVAIFTNKKVDNKSY